MGKSILKVVSTSELMEDKNGFNYKVVEFETPSKQQVMTAEGMVTVRSEPRRSKRSFWAQSYIDLYNKCEELGFV